MERFLYRPPGASPGAATPPGRRRPFRRSRPAVSPRAFLVVERTRGRVSITHHQHRKRGARESRGGAGRRRRQRQRRPGLRRRPAAGPGETLRGTDFRVFSGGKGANQAIAARAGGGSVLSPAPARTRSARRRGGRSRRRGSTCASPAPIRNSAPGSPGSWSSRTGRTASSSCPGRRAAGRGGRAPRRPGPGRRGRPPAAAGDPARRRAGGRPAGGQGGAQVVLNPAPAPAGGPDLPPDLQALLAVTDVLVPNETEAAQLTGIETDSLDGAAAAGRALLGPRPAGGAAHARRPRGPAG